MDTLKLAIKYKKAFSLAIYVIVCGAFFPSLRYMAGPDALSYITIAELYANGDWRFAINAYWSPGFSLLLSPFITAGINGITAIKILNIFIGGFLLVTLSSLGTALNLDRHLSTLLLLAAVPFAASSAYLNTTPDLLVVLILVVYVTYLLRFCEKNQIRNGAFIGIFGFIGYLSKYYLFPFFLLHYSGCVVLRYLTKSGTGPNIVGFSAGLATFILLASIWMGAIYTKYGTYTYALTGPTVRAMFSPPRGIFNLNIPFGLTQNKLADPGARSVHLPDPSLMLKPEGALSHLTDWSPIAGWREIYHQWALIKNGFTYAGYWMFRFSPFLIPIIFILGIVPIFSMRNEVCFIAGLMAWTSVALLSGYLTLSVEGRFILFLWVIGSYGGVWLIKQLSSTGHIYPVIIVFILSFSIMPTRWLIVNKDVDAERARTASTLKTRFGVAGRVASNGRFIDTAFLIQHLDGKYFGALENNSQQNILSQLKLHKINYFFVWRGKGRTDDWSLIGSEVTNGEISDLAVYRVE